MAAHKIVTTVYLTGLASSVLYHANDQVLNKNHKNYLDAVAVGTFEGIAKGVIWPISVLTLPAYFIKKYKN